MIHIFRSLVVLQLSDGAEGVGGGRGQGGVRPITDHFLPGCRHRSRKVAW